MKAPTKAELQERIEDLKEMIIDQDKVISDLRTEISRCHVNINDQTANTHNLINQLTNEIEQMHDMFDAISPPVIIGPTDKVKDRPSLPARFARLLYKMGR